MSKVLDAGEVLPNAPKLRPSKQKEPKRSEDLLSILWPEPDWKEIVDSGVLPSTAATMACVYWSIGKTPVESQKFNYTPDEARRHYTISVLKIKEIFANLKCETKSEIRNKVFESFGIKNANVFETSKNLYLCGRFGGRTFYSPFSFSKKIDWLHSSLADLGWPHDDSCLKANICIAEMRVPQADENRGSRWAVVRISGRMTIVEGGNRLTHEQAVSLARQEIDKHVAKGRNDRALNKIVTSKISTQGAERVGNDVLQGRDISPEEFIETFGFRGVQYGESMSSTERQLWTNRAYEALSDLSLILGFRPKWLGLRGSLQDSLGFAIGARGKGDFSAHYEPSLRVFNFTRERGSSCIAHEYAHALDHYLCLSTYAPLSEAYGKEILLTKALTYRPNYTWGNPEKHKAVADLLHLLKPIRNSEFFMQAWRIERLKGARKNYWTDSSELWARSFEAFVEDWLAMRGLASPWLVYGTQEDVQPDPEMSPYPRGQERKRLFDAWSKLIERLTSK